jgi:hypothetical protein
MTYSISTPCPRCQGKLCILPDAGTVLASVGGLTQNCVRQRVFCTNDGCKFDEVQYMPVKPDNRLTMVEETDHE